MRRRGDVAATLMGRPGGGHEVDPVERERFAYLLGAAQMPEVNGIKGAAEQSYSLNVRPGVRGQGLGVGIVLRLPFILVFPGPCPPAPGPYLFPYLPAAL